MKEIQKKLLRSRLRWSHQPTLDQYCGFKTNTLIIWDPRSVTVTITDFKYVLCHCTLEANVRKGITTLIDAESA